MDTEFKKLQWRSRFPAMGNEAKYSSHTARSLASSTRKHKLGIYRLVDKEGQSENGFTWFIISSLKNLNDFLIY